jgi:putative glutamine amidotransferase
MLPLVGITAQVERVRWGMWDAPVTLLRQRYVEAVHAGGGRAVVVPPSVVGVDRVVAALDGLVLAGGADLEPSLYGARREPETERTEPDRDAGERALLAAASEAGLPVLGICRGMQLMVAMSGGRLHQHLPKVVGHDGHRPAPGVYGEHPVRTVPGTRLAELLGPTATVPSYHHQGIADPGTLSVSARAEDGTIEAVERPDAAFHLGVLWHPEASDDRRLFRALAAAAQGVF